MNIDNKNIIHLYNSATPDNEFEVSFHIFGDKNRHLTYEKYLRCVE